jgi:NADH-quinone oxidoreductase subunit G
VPVVGQDERFANGFTIRAEKCPNRRGVEAVLRDFTCGVTSFDGLLEQIGAEGIKVVWVAGGYREPWIDDAKAERLVAETLIVQDMFDSPLWRRATFQLPGASFAERSGSYVNHADRLQSFEWAIRPPAGAWVEGHLYWRMLGLRGLYNPRTVLSEMAAKIGYFAAAGDEVPPTGIDLKVNQLAAAT